MSGQIQLPSPSGRCLVKLVLVLVFCCFAECAAGGCIRYGHSCWGGHGKRSHPEAQNDLNINVPLAKTDEGPSEMPFETQNLLNRLMRASSLRIFKGRDVNDVFQALKDSQDFPEENDDLKLMDDSLVGNDIKQEIFNSNEEYPKQYSSKDRDNWRLIRFLKKMAAVQ